MGIDTNEATGGGNKVSVEKAGLSGSKAFFAIFILAVRSGFRSDRLSSKEIAGVTIKLFPRHRCRILLK